jgi:hypothetical protein
VPNRQAPTLRAVPVYALGNVEPHIHPDADIHPDGSDRPVPSCRQRAQRFRAELRRLEA